MKHVPEPTYQKLGPPPLGPQIISLHFNTIHSPHLELYKEKLYDRLIDILTKHHRINSKPITDLIKKLLLVLFVILA